MREQIEARLVALRSEHDKGQLQLQQLQNQVNGLRETVLRISGAIMVLEELLSASAPVRSDGRREPIRIAADTESSARNDRFTAVNKED